MQLSNRAIDPNTVAESPSLLPVLMQPISTAPARKGLIENPPASTWSLSRSKRLLDILVSSLTLVIFALPMLVIALFVRLSSHGPSLFVQNRVGRKGRSLAFTNSALWQWLPKNASDLG